MEEKDIFVNIPFLLQEDKFLLDDMNAVFEMLEEWGMEDSHNVLSSINPFFFIENDKYIFYIDDKSIFYNGKSTYEYSFGELFVSTANVLRKRLDILPPKKEKYSAYIYMPAHKPISNKYKDYTSRYTKPTLDFLKEFYQDLVLFGFLEITAILIIRDFLIWQSTPDVLENFDPKQATSIGHGLIHCMDSIYSEDFFLYDEKFFDTKQPYYSMFLTSIIPLNGTLTILYLNVSLKNIYTFDRYNIFSKKYTIKICDYCKCFFIQKKDYNAKYCDECREISNEKKTRDQFYKIYRSKYKTMKMRASRSENQIDYEIRYTIPWENDIKAVIDVYRKNDDLSGFKAYLNESMKKYKP